MGAECVRSTSKPSMNNHFSNMDLLGHQLMNCDENLIFTMTIEHLRLTNMTDKVKQIKFSLQKEFEIVYCLKEFSIQENLIKSEKIHKTQFQIPAKCLDSKKISIEIINFRNQIIQALNLKLVHLCTGPVHHDHLLKELKARLMFDLHLYQNINLTAKCKDLKIQLYEPKILALQDMSYKFVLTTQIDQNTFESKDGYFINGFTFQQQSVFVSIPNNILKESNFRFEFLKTPISEFQMGQSARTLQSIIIPYRKIQNFQTFASLRKKQIDYIKKTISFDQPLKQNDKIIGKITFVFQIQSSILYAEQMDCLIFSQIGFSSVSPTISYQSNDGLMKELKQIYKSVKKIKNSVSEQKTELIKNIDQIYSKFQKSNQEIFTSEEDLYQRQITLVKLLNELSNFFSEGQDILNQRLWRTINYIVHKPQLSTRYLTLHQNQNTKKEVYLIYYKFIVNVLAKIIICTGTGITFHELQCIQKFIAFSYFRFPWIQNKILDALKRRQDPIITEQKLIEFGANCGCRSPSKSYVYDWQINVFRKIESDKQFKEMIIKLQQVSSKYDDWDELLFNRDDEDLFYGLYLQIWNQAQITLKNLRGKILWEYFPNYGQLLSAFLGQMNNSKISDFSVLFKQCSNKLVLNERLLNTFVVQLFPKTHLFETSCVLKCLNLLQSYFQVLTKQNKKLPHDFHFNFFYTGIKSIFQQNHSYLVVKTLFILYKYYEIFTQDFKKTLNNYLLSSIFYNLFLHWCTNVRKMFYHLIYYKVLQKKISNPEQINDALSSLSQLGKSKQVSSSQEYYLVRKINMFLRAVENYCLEINKQNKNKKKQCSQPYHEKMKVKLQQKKKKKAKEIQKFSDLSQSKISEDPKTSSFLSRKQSMFVENVDIQFYRVRKMSVGDELYCCQKIQEQYKQYCNISLKQYNEVKRTQNSQLEVEKLAQLVQGDIDI